MTPLFALVFAVTGPAYGQAYSSELQDLEIVQETALLDGAIYATGFVPSGSPIGVGFTVQASQTAWVEMLGEAELTWPEALTLSWVGLEGTGWLGLLTELELVTAVQYDIAGYTGEYELDSRSISVEAETTFDPLLLPGSDQTSVTLSSEGALDSWSTSYSPVSVIEIVLSVTSSLTTDTTLEGLRIDHDNGESMEADAETAIFEVPDDTALDVVSEWVGLWNTALNLTVTPSVEICIDLIVYTTCETLVSTDTDIELSTAKFEESFDPVAQLFPLPAMWVSPDDHDFGELLVGASENLALEVGNDGLLNLTGTISIDGDSAFEVWPESVYAPSESLDGLLVSFTPPAPGVYSATLTLTTNDPSQPTLDLTVTGIGYEEGAGDTGDAKIGTIGSEVTCGCTARPSRALAFPALWMGLILARRRRKPSPK
jgi:MYXO-CTERM domain-containing protein